jgi:hypothetical protein
MTTSPSNVDAIETRILADVAALAEFARRLDGQAAAERDLAIAHAQQHADVSSRRITELCAEVARLEAHRDAQNAALNATDRQATGHFQALNAAKDRVNVLERVNAALVMEAAALREEHARAIASWKREEEQWHADANELRDALARAKTRAPSTSDSPSTPQEPACSPPPTPLSSASLSSSPSLSLPATGTAGSDGPWVITRRDGNGRRFWSKFAQEWVPIGALTIVARFDSADTADVARRRRSKVVRLADVPALLEEDARRDAEKAAGVEVMP